MSAVDTILHKAAEGAYGEESGAIGKLAGIIRAASFSQSFGPFICGTIGQKGDDGMHDGYIICPAYGADHTAIYKRK